MEESDIVPLSYHSISLQCSIKKRFPALSFGTHTAPLHL
jgi:hypothetical protein